MRERGYAAQRPIGKARNTQNGHTMINTLCDTPFLNRTCLPWQVLKAIEYEVRHARNLHRSCKVLTLRNKLLLRKNWSPGALNHAFVCLTKNKYSRLCICNTGARRCHIDQGRQNSTQTICWDAHTLTSPEGNTVHKCHSNFGQKFGNEMLGKMKQYLNPTSTLSEDSQQLFQIVSVNLFLHLTVSHRQGRPNSTRTILWDAHTLTSPRRTLYPNAVPSLGKRWEIESLGKLKQDANRTSTSSKNSK